jgi:hypothetical protein
MIVMSDPNSLTGSSRWLHSSLLVGYAHHGHAKATVIRCRYARSDAWHPRPGQSPGLQPFSVPRPHCRDLGSVPIYAGNSEP